MTIPDLIGYTGVALLIITYGLLQTDRIDPKGFWYSFNNMIVAILVSVSLLYTMNKASMVIEVFWFIISVYGLIQYRKRRLNDADIKKATHSKNANVASIGNN